jgi:hypothetical protein
MSGVGYAPGAAAGSMGFNPSYVDDNGDYGYNGVSQDPALSVGGYGSEAAAQAAWFAQNPSYGQYLTDPSVAANGGPSGPNLTGLGGNAPGAGTAAPAAPGGTASGLPTAAQVQTTAPAPISAFGATPSVTPTYANATGYAPSYANATGYAPSYAQAAQQGFATTGAATVDPNANYGYLNREEAANAASLQPQFQAQDQAEQDQLAARGISSSGAAQDLTNQLYEGQGATLASMNAPAIQQQSGYTQADIAANQANTQGALTYNAGAENAALANNAGYQQQTGLTNAAAGNAASAYNATNAQQVGLTNAAAGNTASEYNATNAQSTGLYNANVANNAAGTNAGYYASALGADYGAYNTYLQQLNQMGYGTSNAELGTYLNSFAPSPAVGSAYGTATSGIGNTYGNVFGAANQAEGQTIGSAFGAIGTAAGAGAFG